jgi:hypothetical protein
MSETGETKRKVYLPTPEERRRIIARMPRRSYAEVMARTDRLLKGQPKTNESERPIECDAEAE